MTALALFGLSFGTCLAAAAAAYRWIIRPLKQRDRPPLPQRTPADVLADAAAHRARRIADANARLGRVPAADDNTEGTRLDWHDECERLWVAPYDPQTGLDLLRRDIRKQQREEG